jgi:hypothetical protein
MNSRSCARLDLLKRDGYVNSYDEINKDLKPHNLFSFHHRLT